MSNDAINHIWKNSKQKGSHLVVMLAIADSANTDGFCWWGSAKLSKRARISETRLRQIITDLELSGELSVVQGGQDENGKNIPNHYYVNGIRESAPKKARQPKTPTVRKSAFAPGGNTGTPPNTIDPQGDNTGEAPGGNIIDPPGGNTGEENPSIDPSSNPSLEPSPPNGGSPDPEEIKPVSRPRDYIYEVISWAWKNNNGGHIGRLKKTLTGNTTKTDGKNHQPYFVEYPADATLILAFSLWWFQDTGLKMPTSPATLAEKFQEFDGVLTKAVFIMAAAERLSLSAESGVQFQMIDWSNPARWPMRQQAETPAPETDESESIRDETPADLDALDAVLKQGLTPLNRFSRKDSE